MVKGININEKVYSTLLKSRSANKIPVRFMKYEGEEDTFITFMVYFAQENEYYDDERTAKEYYIKIDIFSKNSYTDIIEDVITTMKENGFEYESEASDLYEEDTKLYHKPIRFRWIERGE